MATVAIVFEPKQRCLSRVTVLGISSEREIDSMCDGESVGAVKERVRPVSEGDGL